MMSRRLLKRFVRGLQLVILDSGQLFLCQLPVLIGIQTDDETRHLILAELDGIGGLHTDLEDALAGAGQQLLNAKHRHGAIAELDRQQHRADPERGFAVERRPSGFLQR